MPMIPLPPSVKIVIGTLLVALVAAGQYLLKLDTGWVWLPPAVAALIYIEGFLTVPSGAAKQLADAQSSVRVLTSKLGGMASAVFLVLALGLVGTQTGCAQAVPVVGPTTSCISTVVSDALKGMTIDQILADAGPGCVKDAAEVVAILFGSEKANGTTAWREAIAIRAAQESK